MNASSTYDLEALPGGVWQTLQDFRQLLSMYPGFLVHSPPLAHSAQWISPSMHSPLCQPTSTFQAISRSIRSLVDRTCRNRQTSPLLHIHRSACSVARKQTQPLWLEARSQAAPHLKQKRQWLMEVIGHCCPVSAAGEGSTPKRKAAGISLKQQDCLAASSASLQS